jgi:hypothetical protein
MIDSKFEEFAKDRGLNTEKLCHGDYKLFVTGEAYAAWQAARAQDGGEPVTDFEIECDCGDLYRADSFGGGFIAGAGMCENCLTTHNSDHLASAVVPDWTKCSIEMPNKEMCVDLWASRIGGHGNGDQERIENCFRDHWLAVWWKWDSTCTRRILLDGVDVTHWMLRPAPPEQEQES